MGDQWTRWCRGFVPARTGWRSRDSTWKRTGERRSLQEDSQGWGRSKSWDRSSQTAQDSGSDQPLSLLPADRREVKVGEYNAVADTLEIINDTIRFQGKAGGLLGGGGLLSCSQA